MKLLSRLFGRSAPQKPVVDRRRMNEDWKTGDLAECLRGDWQLLPGPVAGGIYLVTGVREGPLGGGPDEGALVYGLSLREFGPEDLWLCTSFRKIRPLHEPCEAEFSELIRRPVRKREDA